MDIELRQESGISNGINMFEDLITAPFIIICALVAIAFFVGMKVGEDNIRVEHKKDKLQRWKSND